MKTILACIALLLTGCFFSWPRINLEGLQVESISPEAFVVSRNQQFEIIFSENIDPKAKLAEVFELVELGAAGELSSKKIALNTRLETQKKVVAKAEELLRPNQYYRLVISEKLRDIQGNPLLGPGQRAEPFHYTFVTEDSEIILLENNIANEEASLVAPNRRLFQLRLSGLVEISPQLVTISGTEKIPRIERVWQDQKSFELNILLAADYSGCAVWQPESSYSFVINPRPNKASQPITISFTTGKTCDETPLSANIRASAIAADTTALVRAFTRKKGQAFLWFGAADGPLDCLGQPCPLRKEKTGVFKPNLHEFVHEFEIAGLGVNRDYRFQLLFQDERMKSFYDEGVFSSQEMPAIVINEVMSNPLLPEGLGESSGEYIELYNSGEKSYLLDGFRLVISKQGGKEQHICQLPNGYQIHPKQYMLVAGESFIPSNFVGIQPGQLLLMPTKTICGALSNSGLLDIRLKDREERLVSAFIAPIQADFPGRSIERAALSAGSVADYCLSRRDMGPSPGAGNGILSKGCERYAGTY